MKKAHIHHLQIALFLSIAIGSGAQDNLELKDSIYSEVLKETRTLEIRLPKSYQAGSGENYEVIYILDGEWNIENFSFIYNFAMEDEFVPPVILVALPNTYIEGQNMRDRDFLPLKMKNNERAGGADKFLEFIGKELIPYIDGKLPSSGVNSLYGHSYGGVFSMYAMLARPDLFDAYYCTDPPLGWENGYLEKLAEETFGRDPDLEKTLWIAGTSQNNSIRNMRKFLEKSAPENLHWETATYPDEKHNSVRLKGIYDGIKFRNRK